MMRIAISKAASALVRALMARSGTAHDRIFLTDSQSVDWRSLTFNGERHVIELRIPGPHSSEVVERMCAGLDDAEFRIPGAIVADIAVAGTPTRSADGSISITIEALTIADD
jgi:hypothetical protein